MRRLPPLNALRAFEAAARHESFSKAADELNLTPSALSHQVRHLEELLNVPLFERRARRVVLTDAGGRMLPALTEGFDRLQDGVRRALAVTPDDILVVSTGPSFAAKWLAPRIYKFVEAHPQIELRIAASMTLANFIEDGAEVALRFGPGIYPGLHVQPLFEDYTLPLASPALADGDPPLNAPADLAHHTLLHDSTMAGFPGAPTWADWLKAAGVTGVDGTKGLRFTHEDHAIDATIEGAGVMLGRLSLSARDLKLGRLVAPFDLKLKTRYTQWFCCPPEMLEKEKVQVFRNWLLAEVADDQAEWPI